MPTYDYRCRGCGHEFEVFQSISAEELRKCPECGKLKLKRLMGGGAAIVFKGSGFYQTDYRSESYKTAAKADAPATVESKSDSKTESKAEVKSEAKPAATSSPRRKANSE
jgi:putative FmdB family regulatory protein